MNWTTKFCPTWPLTNWLAFFKHVGNFLQRERFPNQQDAENAFQEFAESWSIEFLATGINKLIFTGKNVLTVTVPLFINIDVFEPSYNDL